MGSYENVNKKEVHEATRMFQSNFEIFDYDTLNSLFLASQYSEARGCLS